MIKQGKERCEPGREDRLERVGSKKIIFAWKMHDCLLVLWFGEDDTVINTEMFVCMYSDRMLIDVL